MSSIANIRAQLKSIPLPTESFADQTIIVTGSNTGLGLEAARHFVRLNAERVILAVRSLQKGEQAKASIEKSTGRKNVVEVWLIDMSNYDSIKAFATFCQSLDRLDVVVANAGVLRNTYEAAGGTEITIAVNVIGTFLLALNLFPILRRSRQNTGQTPRLVITSSVLHEEVSLPGIICYNFEAKKWKAKFQERHESQIFEAFKKDKKPYLSDRYNTSKLLEVLLVRSISEEIKTGPHASEPLILNTVNPGLCHSELDKDVKGMAGYALTAAKALLARTTEVGGRTLVHSAAAGIESDGQYMSECKVKEPSKFVRSTEGALAQKRVHQELMHILDSIQPGITKNI